MFGWKEYSFKLSSFLSWFRICIHIVNPKCHLLKAPKIEFTFSALSSAHWTLQCQNQNKIVYCFTNCLFWDGLSMLSCNAVLRDFSRIIFSFVHFGQYWTRFALLRFATQTNEMVRFSTFLWFLPKWLSFWRPAASLIFFNVSARRSWAWIWARNSRILFQLSVYCRLRKQDHHLRSKI